MEALAIAAGMTHHHTMGRARIVITVDERALAKVDRLVADGVFPNRSEAFETAVRDRIAKLHRSMLVRECAKLDRSEEQALAEEGFRWGA